MAPRPRPQPPHPELTRRPGRSFGWLDARLLREGWLPRLGSEAIAVLSLLALAADERGASFYGRDKMAIQLGLDRGGLDRALAKLQGLGLIAQRPWSAGHPDGVWQLLEVPAPARQARNGPTSIGELLGGLLSRPQPE